MSVVHDFDLCGALPLGHLAIEASAGTGKTYTLAALATRYLAERELDTSDLLVVSFTRAATSELRGRLRDRLVEACEHLERGEAGDDPLLAHLAGQDALLRLGRLRRAVTEFDAATVTTIHGFATQVLATLGTRSGADPDAAMVDDSAQLAAECCADVLAAAALDHSELPTFDTLVKRTRTAINIPDLRLAPGDDQLGVAADADLLLVRLVERSIELMRRRRRDAATLSFDDVLLRLRDALSDPEAATLLRHRFKLALVDEFQDTDPVQWDIFRAMFPDPGSTDSALVLVGDPKQSIYAFRGANVHTYLGAVQGTGARPPTLGTNWRSDGAVLDAVSTLLRGVTFGDDAIGFADVAAAEVHRDRRLRDVDGTPLPALSLRLAVDPSLGRTKRGTVAADAARAAIEDDLVLRVRDLLLDGRLPVADDPEQARGVQPSDVAVLVRSNDDAAKLCDALKRQGIPAVLSRGGSVLDSPAADQWRWLLDAMSRPSDPSRARTFALSWFGGRTADWVATAEDDDLLALQEQLAEWVAVLAERGVVELQRRIWSETDVVARVLRRPDGDRELTDLEHVAELLCSGARAGHQGVVGLSSILDAPAPIEVDADVDRDQLARRVESEAKAVQVMTVWVAKGLEFPIVCIPTMWSTANSAPIVPDNEAGVGSRLYDLASSPWPDRASTTARKARAEAEALGENLRLLYVALTRARHQVLVWWAPVSSAARAGLTRVLFARTPDGALDPDLFSAPKFAMPTQDVAAGLLEPLVAASGGVIELDRIGAPATLGPRWRSPGAEVGSEELAVARLEQPPDRTRRRWSFTTITAGERAHEDPDDATGADAGAADEPDALGVPEGADEAVSDGPSPDEHVGHLAALPAGASFGTLAHHVLERVDFTSASLPAELREEIELELARRHVDLAPWGRDGSRGTEAEGVDLLVRGLVDAVDTPLGPVALDHRLRDVAPSDRLDEVEFDLQLGVGPGAATDAEVGALIESHLAPRDLFDDQPLHGWASGLADGRFGAVLAGHLTGSIDAVLRLRDPEGRPTFVVVDYKTNRLTPRGAAATSDDYDQGALVDAMAEHHYPLQALLYSVAVHRYLRWRLPDYDPDVHLGGVAYLFLRGMVGERTPRRGGRCHGVFSWRVPPRLVEDLSDLLDGHRDERAGSAAP